MIENEDQQEQMPRQGKLVLPAYPDEEPYASSSPQPQVRPDQLIQHKTKPAPKNPLVKIGYYWRKDPAYKVLMIAAVMVIVAGFIFVSLATAAFLRNPNFFGSGNTTPQNPTGSSPSGPVDLRPTFPTPGGGSGGNSSSQPPAQSTPVIQATATGSTTPTPQPSQTPGPGGGGTLTVQITSIPSQVNNNSTVQVSVMTNEAGATVRLVVSYSNAYPPYYTSTPQLTDGNGNATLYWNVQISSLRGRHIVAKVTAVAMDQSGQYATSPPDFVQVIVGFGGTFVL